MSDKKELPKTGLTEKQNTSQDIAPEQHTGTSSTVTKENLTNQVSPNHQDADSEYITKNESTKIAHQDKALPTKAYETMSLETLTEEFRLLLKNEKIEDIKTQVSTIKTEFDYKFNAFLEEKKEAFLEDGGNEIDFHFNSPIKKEFNHHYKTYKSRQQELRKALETSLKANLQARLAIIETIKGLITVEENINTTYKNFRQLQEQWRTIGAIPRDRYNNVWNTYHHHVERFYDFLHLNRDLRDLDFKHNLDQKLKIILRAEELAKDDNTNRSFRELQELHKLWKEELGPVAKEYREPIWERFSAATKSIHDKRQLYYAEQDKIHEVNLIEKNDIISKIESLAEHNISSHSDWQNKIKTIDNLREAFFKAGKVPLKVNETTWSRFKNAVKTFNQNKNTFYKTLKKEQYTNLQKKIDLIKLAESNKDNDNFELATPIMKKIQNDWKTIGHVPRKDSDALWKQFRAACNHYFDRLNAARNTANKEEVEALEKKEAFLERIKHLEFTSQDDTAHIEQINSITEEWKTLGTVAFNKRQINSKFTKAIDTLYGKLNLSKPKIETLKYRNKLESLATDKRLLDNEHSFIRKKIDETKSEINQLENNLQFFSNVNTENPLVKEVLLKIENHKSNLNTWQVKLKAIKKYF